MAYAFTNTNSSSSSLNLDYNALEDGGNLIVDSDSLDKNNMYYRANSSEVNGILVKNGGALKLANSLINKTGDTQTSGDDADFYGVNSAILVNTNGTLDISNVELNTNSKGSNGIFVTNAEASSTGNSSGASQPPEATGGDSSQGGNGGQPPEMPSGEGSGEGQGGGGQPGETTVSGTTEAKINNVKITTHSDKSRGLDATYNGKITANNVIINTDGQSCAALATDRGGEKFMFQILKSIPESAKTQAEGHL